MSPPVLNRARNETVLVDVVVRNLSKEGRDTFDVEDEPVPCVPVDGLEGCGSSSVPHDVTEQPSITIREMAIAKYFFMFWPVCVDNHLITYQLPQ